MSTKNLARSVIEGGRSVGWKEATRMFKRRERRITREFLHKMRHDEELRDEPIPQREKPWWGGCKFKDNLHYIELWLTAQCGRPWDDVYSELCQRYDRRRVRNWHLIDDHLKRLVNPHLDDQSYCKFVVDDDGLLRSDNDFTRAWGRSNRPKREVPETWPIQASTHTSVSLDTVSERLFSSSREWYFITRAGHFFWVQAKTFSAKTVWSKREKREVVRYYPHTFEVVRELTNEELDYLQSLCSYRYDRLRFQRAKSDRRSQNWWRQREGLEPLPEVTLIEPDHIAI